MRTNEGLPNEDMEEERPSPRPMAIGHEMNGHRSPGHSGKFMPRIANLDA